MTVDLNTCVPGQLCVTKDGEHFTYVKKFGDPLHYPHLLLDQHSSEKTFTNDGIYDFRYLDSKYNIVHIIPMESTTSNKHPSVAWWESCPWITDRKPTALDGDIYGRVYIKSSEGKVLASNWSDVSAYENWIHLCGWQPPVLSNKEQALELLNKHEGGWCPTPKEWTIIRKGLEE
jgi:hypothetical protein